MKPEISNVQFLYVTTMANKPFIHSFNGKTNLSTSEQFPLCTFKTFNGVFKVFTAANDLVELFLKVNDLRKKLNRNETL